MNQYCIYKNMKLLRGSSFKTAAPDCIECKCTNQGLRCCGFGFQSGVIVPPEGCIAHNDACNLIFVKITNSSEVCYQSNSINRRKKNQKVTVNRQTSII